MAKKSSNKKFSPAKLAIMAVIVIALVASVGLVKKIQDNRSKAALGLLRVLPGSYVCGSIDHTKVQYCKGPGDCATGTTIGDWVQVIDCDVTYGVRAKCIDKPTSNNTFGAKTYMAYCVNKEDKTIFRNFSKKCESGRFNSSGDCVASGLTNSKFWSIINGVCKLSSKTYADIDTCTAAGSGDTCYNTETECRTAKNAAASNNNIGASCTGYLGLPGKCAVTGNVKFSDCYSPFVDNGFVSIQYDKKGKEISNCKGTNVRCCTSRRNIPVWDGTKCTSSFSKYIDVNECNKDTSKVEVNGTVCYPTSDSCNKAHKVGPPVAKPSCVSNGGACVGNVRTCTTVEGGRVISGTNCSGSTPVCCKK